ncbi:hypothetical protein Tco_1576899 [Tanacetum coccineum]
MSILSLSSHISLGLPFLLVSSTIRASTLLTTACCGLLLTCHFEVLKEGVTRSESAAVEGVLTVFGEWTNLPQEFAWVPRWAASLPV